MFEWIVNTITQWGYGGIVFLMFAENVFPPIPSELIMPLAGFAAARGDLNVFGVLAAGILGTILGTLPWYYAGRILGLARLRLLASRFGRVMTITPEEVDQAASWFQRYGHLAVFYGRLIPAIRTIISAPAGVAAMPMGPFLLWTSIGTGLWTSLLTAAGYVLEAQYERVEGWIDPLSKLVVLVVVAVYVWRLITFGRRSRG
ncbi:MAG: DedA family protein [Alphaproteobacteria bacterium]|nr:DedA family protein [Alphaproteobacteria bacterium]TAD89073.1 MAG: DedA family protein [Alphaproteobacteria bacterium]